MPLVLALEPDLRQAAIVTRVVRDTVGAELVLVDSRDAAITALAGRTPDVVLLTALLSPRDEDDLLAHLRAIPKSDHVQTHTIPQLGTAAAQQEPEGGGLLGKLRKKKKKAAEPIAGCDPALFAAEVRSYVARAEELKAEAEREAAAAALDRRDESDNFDNNEGPFADAVTGGVVIENVTPDLASAASAWSSPFEWRRSEPIQRSDEPIEIPAPLRVSRGAAGAARQPREDRGAGEEKAQREREARARQEEEQNARAAAERERLRVEAEAAAERERLRVEAEAAAERERLRLKAEAEAAERERLRIKAEAEAAAERERLRLKAEAAAKRERQRLEAEAAAERERLRLEAEAAAKRERLRLEAEAAAERERLRLEAEAAAERERLRLEAEAAAERERLRLEAEAAAERERLSLEAEAAAEAQAALDRKAEREREMERERLLLEEELQRAAAALAASQLEDEAAGVEIDLDAELQAASDEGDPFADFREGHDEALAGILRLIPVTEWARAEAASPAPGEAAAPDDLESLISRLLLPPDVAGVRYGAGCRIRRVRVPAAAVPPAAAAGPVILSRKALNQIRGS